MKWHVQIRYEMSSDWQKDQRFEANSDNEVLCLLDMVPSQELMDEGLARELINRVQKLKKKGGLFPTDSVIVYFSVNQKGSELHAKEPFEEYRCQQMRHQFSLNSLFFIFCFLKMII